MNVMQPLAYGVRYHIIYLVLMHAFFAVAWIGAIAPPYLVGMTERAIPDARMRTAHGIMTGETGRSIHRHALARGQ